MVTNLPKYGHRPYPGLSNTILRMVTHHYPKVDHPPSQGRPSTISRMVTHYPKGMVAHHPWDGHPPTVKISPTIRIPGKVINQNLQFDSSTAQLVSYYLIIMAGLKVKFNAALFSALENFCAVTKIKPKFRYNFMNIISSHRATSPA